MMATMRVLHLVKTSTGATWALRQMRELVKLGIEVHVALPPGGPLVERYLADGITVHPFTTDFPIRAPWLFPEISRRLDALVSGIRPDIIHSHFVGTTLTMRLALGRHHRIPRIFQVPGPLHLEHQLYRKAEIWTAGPLDFWVGSCRWTCDRYLRSGISPERLALSYYGVDLAAFEPGQSGRLRQELGVGADMQLVGMVAYMYAPKRYLGQRRGLKGHEDLIEALALCRKANPRIVGVFVGGAWSGAEDYERQVRAYGRRLCGDGVVFLGTRDDVPQLYPDLALAVHPSHSENVGGAVESMLMGVPTIATNVGGFPDVVIDGKTGRLVPPGNPQRLAEVIREVLAQPETSRAMAAEGRSLVEKLFAIEKNAGTILEFYEDILRRTRSL